MDPRGTIVVAPSSGRAGECSWFVASVHVFQFWVKLEIQI